MNLRKNVSVLILVLISCCILAACTQPVSYDVILRGGTIYDGSGEKPFTGDVALKGDKIAALGDLGKASAKTEINVRVSRSHPGLSI